MPPRSTPGKKMVWQTMMPNRPFIPGQPISARSLNKVAAEAGRRLTVSSPLEITHDGMSTNIRLRTWYLPQWFEIVSPLNPSSETTFDYETGDQGTVQDDVISCLCRHVRLDRGASKYVQLPADPQQTLVRVYFPRIPHYAREFLFTDGPLKRIRATFNMDTGRWESDYEPGWIWVEASGPGEGELSIGATGVWDEEAQSYNDVDDDVLSGNFRIVLYDDQENTFEIDNEPFADTIRVYFPRIPAYVTPKIFFYQEPLKRIRAEFNRITGRWESDYEPGWVWVEVKGGLGLAMTNGIEDNVLSASSLFMRYDDQANTFQVADDVPGNRVNVYFPNVPVWQDYIFDTFADCRRLRAEFNRLTGRWETGYTPDGTYFAKIVNGPVPAAVCGGGTYALGVGEAHLHRISGSSLVPVLESDGVTPVIKNVYQHSGEAIPVNSYVQIERTAECKYKISTVLCEEVCDE